ncbi:MAG: S41 family peptidase [Chloroflexi bacterium]|nr:S41 family peptidase [Chloroflexota bacterium]
MQKNYSLSLSFHALLSIFVVTIAFSVGYFRGWQVERRSNEFALLAQVNDIVKNNFYGKLPDDDVLQRGAARGYVQAVSDQFTVFLDPPARELETQSLQGEFGGVGANLQRNESGDVVLTPIADMPAEKAGVQKGDVLIAVDGKTITKEMTIDQIIALVRGQINTKVMITVQRKSEKLDFTITRQRIELPSVSWRVLEKDSTIGYINVSRFTEKTPNEMKKAVEELQAKKISGAVIDLRGNGGGLLTSVIDTTKLFVDAGVIMIEVQKGEKEKFYNTSDKGVAADMKLALLVNKGTASASEIFAGALRDKGRAPLIGQTTYGKGSVQLIFPLLDSSSIHVTNALWYTPKLTPINGIGLKPDIEVQPGVDGRDPELDRAVEYLKETGK